MAAGVCYHVINRGNARCVVFHDDADFQTFIGLSARACRVVDMDVLAYCLMPNHIHFVLRPRTDDGLSRWMHWITTTYIHRYRRRHGGSGHLWQGRFKVFPVQDDAHLLTVVRYVERNALRAGLVSTAERWPWGSLAMRESGSSVPPLAPLPVALPDNWIGRVNAEDTQLETEAVRASIARGTPFGGADWVQETARCLGLEHTVRPRGRPSGKTDKGAAKKGTSQISGGEPPDI